MKITNTSEGRAYMKQAKAMVWYHRKQRARNLFKKIIKGALVILAIAGIVQYARWAYPMTVVNVRETITQVDTLTPKINELKAEVLDLLMKCESQGYTEDTGLIVYDSNKVPSIGQYQFQKATVIAYYKKLYGVELTGKEAVLVALDTENARKLASDIIFTLDADKGINNWYNCNKKNGLSAKVEVIKKLSN